VVFYTLKHIINDSFPGKLLV